MYPTHAGSIGYTKLMLWPHKYKVGHIDLILIKHHICQIHLKILNFHMCHNNYITYSNYGDIITSCYVTIMSLCYITLS